ncbi:HAD family hydrolase [Paracoccus pantotrophus]|uniref:HAD family hydrolase n=1 Tax=Paracoccus pantotrophus TaxID=82367 RepID=A0AAE6TSJ7_PARPN|nr:HAD family hydrolase [Paracoccus pantotrophus]
MGCAFGRCLAWKVGAVKPERRFFGFVCERLGIKPAAVMMVGDSATSDIHGARAAGLQAIRICRDDSLRQSEDIANLEEPISAFAGDGGRS